LQEEISRIEFLKMFQKLSSLDALLNPASALTIPTRDYSKMVRLAPDLDLFQPGYPLAINTIRDPVQFFHACRQLSQNLRNRLH